jgi:hypothetical protein
MGMGVKNWVTLTANLLEISRTWFRLGHEDIVLDPIAL